jgi:hypothetical protein
LYKQFSNILQHFSISAIYPTSTLAKGFARDFTRVAQETPQIAADHKQRPQEERDIDHQMTVDSGTDASEPLKNSGEDGEERNEPS